MPLNFLIIRIKKFSFSVTYYQKNTMQHKTFSPQAQRYLEIGMGQDLQRRGSMDTPLWASQSQGQATETQGN